MQKKNSGNVLVSGSLVIDSIFDLKGTIRDAITVKEGKLQKQNLMFTAHEKKEHFGGTAGNIAYGLGLLKEKPIVVSVVGKDFNDYRGHLAERGALLRVYEDKKGFTATFYGMSDEKKEQIGIFQPNAYGRHVEGISLNSLLSQKDWQDIRIAIFAPGTGTSMLKQMIEFKKKAKKDTFVIFDPGQTLLATFTKELLEKALSQSDMLIANDNELALIQDHFKFSLKDIFESGTRYVIETLGAEGSMLHEPHQEITVRALKVKKVIDPTGAGDAFRAGLIHGMLKGASIPDSMRIGARLGAKCVECEGAQTYKI